MYETFNTWFSFKDENCSDFVELAYTSSYSGGDGLVEKSNASRKELIGCRTTLNEAVVILASNNPNTFGDDINGVRFRLVAKNLLLIILMFPEAVRFHRICNHFSVNYLAFNPEPLGNDLDVLTNTWKTASKQYQKEGSALATSIAQYQQIP